jgi:hypothetical protein
MKIITIYSKEMKTTRKRIEDAMKENRDDRILFGGDFNGRIGERGARNWEEERDDGKRKSKDEVENAEGKRLMEWNEENGWEVLNGNKQGDEEGEWTYTGCLKIREFRIHSVVGDHFSSPNMEKKIGTPPIKIHWSIGALFELRFLKSSVYLWCR